MNFTMKIKSNLQQSKMVHTRNGLELGVTNSGHQASTMAQKLSKVNSTQTQQVALDKLITMGSRQRIQVPEMLRSN